MQEVYFGAIITFMKKLMNILEISLVALTFVICVAIARGQILGVLENEKTTEKNNKNLEDITLISDILPTVAESDTSAALPEHFSILCRSLIFHVIFVWEPLMVETTHGILSV